MTSRVDTTDEYWDLIGGSLYNVRHNFTEEKWNELVSAMIWLSDNPNFGSGMEY
jgi:hypothetical protein